MKIIGVRRVKRDSKEMGGWMGGKKKTIKKKRKHNRKKTIKRTLQNETKKPIFRAGTY